MDFTQGEMYYYGGLIALAFLFLVSIILFLVFRHSKKNLMKRINREY